MDSDSIVNLQGGLLPQDNIIGAVVQIVWLVFFVAYMFYGQRIQVKIMLGEIESSLSKLRMIRDKGRSMTISTIKEISNSDSDLESRIDRVLEHLFIPPVDLDPSGIINRLEHLVDVRDFRFKDEIRVIAPEADETQVNNLTNMLEVALSLNQIYKLVRHYYLTGKKTSSFYIILQLQMLLPQIMKESKAFAGALVSFKSGQPIGDGIGALVAAKLMHGATVEEIAKEIVVGTATIEGRTAYILKAKGPGGCVGKPGEAVKKIIEKNGGRIARIIVIDAAQKLEGEKPGEVMEGTGVAIGGPGVDKYKVEEIATKYKIPVNAILIKEGVADVITTMRREISDSIEDVIQRIERVIRETTKESEKIIIAGIGNTMGIAQ